MNNKDKFIKDIDNDMYQEQEESYKDSQLLCLSYEKWYEIYEEEILIELAETGADRELDFNLEAEFEKRYEKYREL